MVGVAKAIVATTHIFLLLTLPLHAQAEAKSEDADATLAAAREKIEKDEEGSLSADVRLLAKAIETYESRLPDSFLTNWLPSMTSAVALSGVPLNDPLDKLVAGFVASYEEKEKALPIRAAKRRAASLDGLIAETAVLKEGGVVIDEFDNLQTSLESVEAAFPVTSLLRRASVVNEQLKDAVVVAKLKERRDEPLLKLRDSLTRILGPASQTIGIHIVSAQYGDLNRAASAQRRCNALPHLVGRCEGKGDCKLGVAAENVCGYDPVPLLEPQQKALYVEYACISAGENRWAELQVNRRKDLEGLILGVQLRSANDALACQKPS